MSENVIAIALFGWIIWLIAISDEGPSDDNETPDTPFEIAAVEYVEDAGVTAYTYYCLEASSEYAQCDFTLYQDDFVSFLSLFCYVNEENVYCILK